MLLKLICHQNRNGTKTKMLPKLNVTKTKISLKHLVLLP